MEFFVAPHCSARRALVLTAVTAFIGTWSVFSVPLPAQGQGEDYPSLGSMHQQAIANYERFWQSSNEVVPFSDNAAIPSCSAGSATPQALSAAVQALNYARSLNHLSPLSVPADYAATPYAQAAALTAAASPSASNFPTAEAGFACVSPQAKLGAASGLIARSESIVSPATEMLRYFTEASLSDTNDSLGHRLQLLNPKLANVAIGLVSTGTAGPSASSVQTFDSNYRQAGISLFPPISSAQRPAPRYLTWPAQGFFPTTLLPTGAGESVSRWSFSAKCADLRAARVRVNGPDGPVPVQVVRREEPGVDEGRTPWRFAGYDTVLVKVPTASIRTPEYYHTTNLQVQIDNIRPASAQCQVADSYSYQVSLFDPRWPADPQADFDKDGIPNYLDSQPRIPDLSVGRISGSDRIQTAINIATTAFPEGAGVVYLARSDVYADALSGGVLKDGPVLLLPAGQVPPQVRQAIATLNPRRVIALGGTNAVSNAQLRQAANFELPTSRVAGSNRYSTALLIARRAFAGADTLYLASSGPDLARSGADAVSGTSLPDGPIGLVSPSGANLAELAQLARDLRVKRVVALGGPRVLPAAFVREVAQSLPAARLAGRDRYATSRLIASEAVRIKPSTKVYLSRGDIVIDALTGGCLKDGPILLVKPGQDLDTASLQVLAVATAYQTVALGGEKAVPAAQLRQALRWPFVQQILPAGL